MLARPEITIKEVAGVNRATIYRSLALGSYAKGASSRRDETRGKDHQQQVGDAFIQSGGQWFRRSRRYRGCAVIGDTAD